MNARPVRASLGLSICMLLAPFVLWAQTGVITGEVTGAATGEALAGSQVFVQELDIGALSQASGRFTIQNVPAGSHSVTVQRVGYVTQTVDVTVGAGETVVADFQMEDQAIALDEIVVTGTAGGTQRRAIGNAVERLDITGLREVAPAATVDEVLAGRIPGLYTVQGSGQAGMSGSRVRIRGVSSLGVSNDPIVYVDGVRIDSSINAQGLAFSSRMNDINPNDIESIEVIKGPAAATLYGTEASNGVIQIITKQGVAGAPAFALQVESGAMWFQEPARFFGDVYGELPGTGEIISLNLYEEEERATGNPPFQYGPIMKANLSVRGGTDLLRYYASFDRAREEGFVAWNVDERMGGRVSLALTPTETLNLTVNGSFLRADTRTAGGNIIGTFRRAHPTERVLGTDPGGPDDPVPPTRGFQIPLEYYDIYNDESLAVDRNTWNMQADFTPYGWLSSRLVVGKDYSNEDEIDLLLREPGAPQGHFGSAGLGRKIILASDIETTTVDFSTTANYQLTESIGTATSVGVQYYAKEDIATTTRGDEFATTALSTVGASARRFADEDFLENKTLGAYIQEQFDWQQRMFLTLAIRADDNSAFGRDFDLATYPKVSGTWVTSEEGFWEIDWIDPLRLRGAWGQAGQQPDAFAATRLYRTEPSAAGLPILTPDQFGNAELGPEKGSEVEIGFDAGLFGGRANLEFTQYWKTTTDAIVSKDVIESTGFPGKQFLNIGEVRNWGTELGIGVGVLDAGWLRWDVGVNYAYMNNEVTKLGDSKRLLVHNRSGQYHVEGFPLGSLWAPLVVSADFVSGNRGSVTNVMCDSGTGPHSVEGQSYMPGGSPVPCSQAPLLYYGRTGEPTWTIQLSNTLTILENWRLYVSADGRGGHAQAMQDLAAGLTTYANIKDRILRDDPIFQGQVSVNRIPTSRYYAGFIRLRELGLQYTLPEALASRVGADRASLRLAAYNLWYLWQEQEYTDIVDEFNRFPERSSSLSDFAGAGHTHNAIPPLQRLTVSLNVGF
ncbi:MAG: SusC/RagA family TonB-linked outer membrane protein [Gammaproteobacteria bacterium]|nr:SusC/RagA family TonB-linked outer membrane protein [Gammaproteobacteria bacterium]